MTFMDRLAFVANPLVWTPVAASLLMLGLAHLQIDGITALSARDREVRQTHLQRATQRFAEEIDNELTRAYFAFQLGLESAAPGDGNLAATCYESWLRTSRYPRLIRDIWIAMPSLDRPNVALARASSPRVTPHAGSWPTRWRLLRLDPRTRMFHEQAVAPDFDRLHARLERRTRPVTGKSAGGHFLPDMIDEDSLSIVVPVGMQMTTSTAAHSGGLHVVSASMDTALVPHFVIVRLDRDYVLRELLPALARQYFSASPEDEGLDYNVVVVSNRAPNRPLYASDEQDRDVPETADATASLLGIRPSAFTVPMGAGPMEPARSVHRGESAAARAQSMTVSVTSDAEYWQLRVTDRSGSLETFAARARWQNIAVSAAMLALLGANLGLLLHILRRARALNRQQMEFIGGVSHELRTPVAVVNMTAANLADGLVRDPDQIRHYGQVIQREGRRLRQMTEQVLSFARIQSNVRTVRECVPVDLLIHNALEPLQPQIAELGFRVSIDLPHIAPALLVDRATTEQAIQNLVSNAMRYSLDRRDIEISAGCERLHSGCRAWIAVQDHGIGIHPDERSLIFEPFRRGRAAVEGSIPGTGLGLSLVWRIMHAHGGRVQVRSTPGIGSTFILSFPAQSICGSSDRNPRCEEARLDH